MRKQAKVAEREGRYKAVRRRNSIINAIGVGVAIIITGLGAAGMLWFAMQYK